MSQDTHVSSSVKGSPAADEGCAEEVDKELKVVEHVVRALFVDKKQKLTLQLKAEMEALREAGAPELKCGSGACGAKTCVQCDQKSEAHHQVLFNRARPQHEKRLVADLARCICDARQAQRTVRRDLAAAHKDLVHLKSMAHDVHKTQAGEIYDGLIQIADLKQEVSNLQFALARATRAQRRERRRARVEVRALKAQIAEMKGTDETRARGVFA
jgi:hypothetical protein